MSFLFVKMKWTSKKTYTLIFTRFFCSAIFIPWRPTFNRIRVTSLGNDLREQFCMNRSRCHSINCSVAKWKLDLIFVVAFKLIHHVTFPRLFSHGDNLFTILAPPNLQYLGTHGFFPGRHHDLPTPGWASETYQKSCHKTNF